MQGECPCPPQYTAIGIVIVFIVPFGILSEHALVDFAGSRGCTVSRCALVDKGCQSTGVGNINARMLLILKFC